MSRQVSPRAESRKFLRDRDHTHGTSVPLEEIVDQIDLAMSNHVATRPVAMGIRLSSMPRGVLGNPVEAGDAVARAVGPRFVGHVAMASDDNLVVVGHVADHQLEVWCGSAQQLTRVAEFSAPVPAGGLVSLVHFRNEWHLFARSEQGRSSHLVSTDLCRWTQLTQLGTSFPAFAVAGVAVRNGHLLLAGRVFVDNTAFGWGMLRSDGRTFEARPVPLPLATQFGVVGPIVNDDGDAVLLLDSGQNRTVATASDRGWTLSLLAPDITPVGGFSDAGDLWMIGHDNATGDAALAQVTCEQVISLPNAELGRVRSAMVHRDHLVVASEC
jgi:hypothetical protein